MAETGRLHSLKIQMLAALLLSALAAAVGFFGFRGAGRLLVDTIYMEPARAQARAREDVDALRRFVTENEVLSSDARSIGVWNRSRPYVRLRVAGGNTVITSDSRGAELLMADSALALRTGEDVGYSFTVNFADRACEVTVFNFSQVSLSLTVTVVSVMLSAGLFLLCMSVYQGRVTRSVRRLSRQVRKVSRGDLQTAIDLKNQDEIGDLAADVDAMRRSMIQRISEEEQAWQANKALITAMSHDVRTPLTALMGYLEILSDESLDPQVRQAYLQVCRSNAGRLKELTDQLFRFFLVFGKDGPELHPERVDGITLLSQILLEAQMELTGEGFSVELAPIGEETGEISVDLTHFRRVFDNIFSNIRKYADKNQPVELAVFCREGRLEVRASNRIPEAAQAVESNRIGLQSCRKLMEAMGGSFESENTGKEFTVRLTLPLAAPG